MENVEYLGFLIEVALRENRTYEYSVFDMAGKDKPEFSLFETDDVEFVSYEAAVDDAKSWIRDFLFNDEDRAVEHIEKLYATKKALSSSERAETADRALQKLTVDVFNRPDCPAWVRYAAVNADGKAALFSDKPRCRYDGWVVTWCSTSTQANLLDDVQFDASDWQNSLIERPVLPKLTAEVFNRPDCPKWAKYAAMAPDGVIAYYRDYPLSDDLPALSYSIIKDSMIERPALQKLTVDVFNRPDCPDWANYAVVNSRGTLIFFGGKPCFEGEDYGCWSCSGYAYKHIKDAVFDDTDWPNSLIERPNKLPEWCKVDAIGWHKRYGYFKVTYIDDVSKHVDIQQVEDKSKGYLSFYTVCNETTQARLRPYNAEEMKGLVGKVVERYSSAYLVISYAHDDLATTVYIEGKYLSADNLLRDYTIDNAPCGVLEHLNEKGEWVK